MAQTERAERPSLASLPDLMDVDDLNADLPDDLFEFDNQFLDEYLKRVRGMPASVHNHGPQRLSVLQCWVIMDILDKKLPYLDMIHFCRAALYLQGRRSRICELQACDSAVRKVQAVE